LGGWEFDGEVEPYCELLLKKVIKADGIAEPLECVFVVAVHGFWV
jgi:hypothetical protein